LGADKKKLKQFDEGTEPSDFWAAVGGKKEYSLKNRYMKRHKRLFQCSIGMCLDFIHSDGCQQLDQELAALKYMRFLDSVKMTS